MALALHPVVGVVTVAVGPGYGPHQEATGATLVLFAVGTVIELGKAAPAPQVPLPATPRQTCAASRIAKPLPPGNGQPSITPVVLSMQ